MPEVILSFISSSNNLIEVSLVRFTRYTTFGTSNVITQNDITLDSRFE